MLELTTGDLLAAEVDALVNAVNTHGVMGKGTALQFAATVGPAQFGLRGPPLGSSASRASRASTSSGPSGLAIR